jgi:hypothetical protein
MSSALDHDSYIPVSCPLERLRNLAFFGSIENKGGKTTKAAAL